MSLYVTRSPGNTSSKDWENLFGRYGRVRSVKYMHPNWRIDFKDLRDTTDALRGEQDRMINGVRLVLTDELPTSNNSIAKDEVSSLRLFINGEVTLADGSKVSIAPVEINVPVKY